MLDRRSFLTLAGGALLFPAAHARADAHEGAAPVREPATDPKLQRALSESGFVYVSPLRSDGSESTCHGEVWFGHFDGAAVLITSRDAWKASALRKGLDRARVWVGDHGRWKQLFSRNEAFRNAPSFVAKAEVVKDDALLEKLLAVYRRKYPDEIGSWEDRMRSGYHDGSRVLIRYSPLGA